MPGFLPGIHVFFPRRSEIGSSMVTHISLLLDVAEDRRRLDEYLKSPKAVPLNDVKAWVASWDTAEELPRPSPRKIG
jgi:hypothetical protein